MKRCKTCGQPFVPEKHNAARQRFCSHRCQWADERRRQRSRRPRTKRCLICKDKFVPTHYGVQMCSDECRKAGLRAAHRKAAAKEKARYAAEGRAFRPARTVEGICLNCSKPFVKLARHFASKNPPKYCNIACYLEHAVTRSSPLRREGEDPYRGGNWRAIRVEVRDADGNCCQLCGKSGAKRNLPVDHIIPARLMVQWRIDPHQRGNLITVCERCHSIKTNIAEPMLLRGDLIHFVLELLAMHYPAERIRLAFELAELSTAFLDRQIALSESWTSRRDPQSQKGSDEPAAAS